MGCGASRQQIAAIEAFTAQAAALAAQHQAAAERAAAVEHAESTPQPTAALAAAARTETADATTPAVTAAPMQEEEAAQKVKAMATSEKRAGAALAAQQGKAWVELTWLERHELCTSPDAAAAAEVAARAALTRSYSSAHQQAPTEPTIVLVLHKDEPSSEPTTRGVLLSQPSVKYSPLVTLEEEGGIATVSQLTAACEEEVLLRFYYADAGDDERRLELLHVSEGGAERAVGELREGCSIEQASLPGQRWVLRRMVGREVAYEATAGTTPELQPHEIDASMPSGATYHEPGGTADKGSEGSPPQLPPLPADTPAKERWVALKNVSVVGGEKPRPSSKESGYLDKSWDGRRAKEARAAVAKLPEQHLGYLTYDIAGSPQVCGLLSADAQLEPCDGGWTCHIFRTHGLPAAGADSAPLFTDDGRTKLPKPCRRPGRGQGIADERRGLCLFDQATPKDLTLSLTRTRTLILTLALNPTPTPTSNLFGR